MRYLLLLILQTASLSCSPLGSAEYLQRTRRSEVIVENEEVNIITTTQSTFKVERLDAPIERIEIRLIDENSTDVGHSEMRASVPMETTKPIIDSGDGAVVTVVEDHTTSNESKQDQYVDDKYKKVEYNSDDERDSVTSETPKDGELEQITTQSTEDGENEDSLEQPRPIQGKAWATLSQMIPKASKMVGMEEPELPPEIRDEENPSEDDEPEPMEACIRNKNFLTPEVAEAVKVQAQKLNRMIKKLNKQMKNYCTSDAAEYRSCPIWREEKMVHYYRLMRITYCSDYNQWPDATRVKRQYQGVLPLFETLYAFQKTDN